MFEGFNHQENRQTQTVELPLPAEMLVLPAIQRYRVDMHSNNKVGEATLLHKTGSKVVGLHCNPVKPDLLLTCGNDHFDPLEFLVVIGRYINENYNGAALHPVDFIDISTGQLIAEVTEPNITTISPANKVYFHLEAKREV
ncbi:protein DAMAGED DNA-BINDING 2-like isoform X1 [Actinidia eriantha]|uniref:protein DAMAGED DNA-BINDING 2-like isoform X1 n=1 Tax=Actinidia eriantha TaxID=165200 RepID=UPI0025832428|nr:protein DAMAGED DNA-BINDING 2-like isoform X1 [Actinidia eriantha]